MNDYLSQNGISFLNKFLTEDSWAFVNKNEYKIIGIILEGKRAIKELDFQINFGIKTGLNSVFYISDNIKDQLIKRDIRNAEIIKPILRGKDIYKYQAIFRDVYVLFMRRGIDIEQYPTIKEYLISHYEELKPKNNGEATGRKPGPYKWYELQDNIAYFNDFKKEKIAWIELSDKPQFILDYDGFYIDATGFILTGENLKFLISILNSKLCEWYFDKITTSSGMGTNRWKKAYVENIPIPEIPKIEMRPFEILVDYITFIKKYVDRISPYTPNAHIAANFEELLDACVYELYFKQHMLEKEIAVIKEVNELLQPIDNLDEKSQPMVIVSIINKVYDEYKSTDNVIRRRILDFPVKSSDIINLIQNG